MHIEQKRLTVLDQAVGVLEVGLPLADGLDLGSAKGHAGFKFFEEKVVVAGHSIVRGVPRSAGHRIAGLGRFLGTGRILGNDDVAGLASHREATSNLHPSIGAGFNSFPARLC
jgi:hypothetical protein